MASAVGLDRAVRGSLVDDVIIMCSTYRVQSVPLESVVDQYLCTARAAQRGASDDRRSSTAAGPAVD